MLLPLESHTLYSFNELTVRASDRKTLTHPVLTATLEVQGDIRINECAKAVHADEIVVGGVVDVHVKAILDVLCGRPVGIAAAARIRSCERATL